MSDTKLQPEDLTSEERAFNKLTPTQTELLALLSEECGEVVQVIGKILRHGLESFHPNGGPTNMELLAEEIGDCLCASRLLASAGMLNMASVEDRSAAKMEKVFRYLHHARRALFAPAPEKVAKVETMADRIAADLKAGTFRGEQPAPPEPAAREMPEAVRDAVDTLRSGVPSYPTWRQYADTLESWWRNLAQPVECKECLKLIDERDRREEQIGRAAAALGMEDEWTSACDVGEALIERCEEISAAANSVLIQQAAQGRKVRDGITLGGVSMSDTKLREKADALIAFTLQGPRFIAWVQAVTDALAPAPEKAATTADRIAADLAAGTFRGVKPEPEKVTCMNCRQRVDYADQHYHREDMPHVAAYFTCDKPAPPEPAATEMPEAVKWAIYQLRQNVRLWEIHGEQPASETDRKTADALESWWRNLAQPVAVGMTEELEHVLSIAERDLRYKEECFDDSARTVPDERIERLRAAIAAVREQFGKRPKLEKVRGALSWLKMQYEPGSQGYTPNATVWKMTEAALAELDDAEGKRRE